MSDVGFYFENTRAGEGDNRAEKGAGQTTELRLSNAREYGVAPSLRRKRLSPPLSMRAMVPEPAVSRWAVPRDFRDRLQGGGHRPTPLDLPAAISSPVVDMASSVLALVVIRVLLSRSRH